MLPVSLPISRQVIFCVSYCTVSLSMKVLSKTHESEDCQMNLKYPLSTETVSICRQQWECPFCLLKLSVPPLILVKVFQFFFGRSILTPISYSSSRDGPPLCLRARLGLQACAPVSNSRLTCNSSQATEGHLGFLPELFQKRCVCSATSLSQ